MPVATAHDARLANTQFFLTVMGGLVLAIPLALVAAVGSATNGAYLISSEWLGGVLRDWVNLVVPLVGISLLPALLTGWLRLKPMRWLLAYCQKLPAGRRVGVAVLGTVLLFELCVALAALLGWALGRGQAGSLGGWYFLCSAISLPWLLAAIGGTWWVTRTKAVSASSLAA